MTEEKHGSTMTEEKKRKLDVMASNGDEQEHIEKRQRDAAAEKQRIGSDADGQWLRSFMGAELYDGNYTWDGRINWTLMWSKELKLPQCEDDLPQFVIEIAKQHKAYHYGSFELQLLLTAINSDLDYHARIAWSIELLAEAERTADKLGAEFVDKLIAALRDRTTYVRFHTPKTAPCASCGCVKRIPKLLYLSWKRSD